MSLEEVLFQYRNKNFIFVEPGGNQGDLMIYAGAKKLADRLGLKYRTILCSRDSNIPRINPDTIVYLHGGGGFNTWWNWTPRLLKMLRKRNPQNIIIVGPTTVAKQRYYLKKYLPKKKDLIFFARERTSLEYLQEHFYSNVMIDHDTALHLNIGDGYLESLTGNLKTESEYRLLAIRDDKEYSKKLPETINQEEFDIVTDPVRNLSKWSWLHYNASCITTNRSHSAILGSILGKPTNLFAGGYHKNRSIFEYSLKPLGVNWID